MLHHPCTREREKEKGRERKVEREKERWNVRGENILLILSVKCINTQRNRERKKMYVKKRWITILG